MDIRTLSAFVTVAREGSLTRAAEKLHLTQPAVGLHIKNLQEQIGLKVFARTSRGMQLTSDGAALLPLAEHVLHAQTAFKNVAQQLSREVSGRLRIGTILDPDFLRLGALLKELLGYGRHLEIALSHGISGEMLQRVMKDELDATFYLSIPDDGVYASEAVLCTVLNPFTYKVVAPAGWESQVRGKDWHQLAALPWLATPPVSAHHRLLSQVFGRQSQTGLDANYVALVDQEASMLDLVKSGVGLSLVRDHIALREAQTHGLVIADQVSLECGLSFACLKSRAGEAPLTTALEALQRIWSPPA